MNNKGVIVELTADWNGWEEKTPNKEKGQENDEDNEIDIDLRFPGLVSPP